MIGPDFVWIEVDLSRSWGMVCVESFEAVMIAVLIGPTVSVALSISVAEDAKKHPLLNCVWR